MAYKIELNYLDLECTSKFVYEIISVVKKAWIVKKIKKNPKVGRLGGFGTLAWNPTLTCAKAYKIAY